MTKEERIREAEERFGDGKPYNRERLLEEIRFFQTKKEHATYKIRWLKNQFILRQLAEFKKETKNG